MAEDPQPLTLQQRIASLNAAHIGRVPGDPPLLRPKPQVPAKRPVVIQRQKSVNNPPEQVTRSVAGSTIGNQPNGTRQDVLPPPVIRTASHATTQARATPPPLPTRKSSAPPPALPALPARRPSEQESRRGSTESQSSSASQISSFSSGASLVTVPRTKSTDSVNRVKAPAWGDCELPPLPARRNASAQRTYSSEKPKYEIKAPSPTAVAEVILPATTETQRRPVPKLPPRLPPRRSPAEAAPETPETPNGIPTLVKKLPVPSAEALQTVKRSALTFGMNKEERPDTEVIANIVGNKVGPPPVPLSSRPDLSAIQSTKPRPGSLKSSEAPFNATPDSSSSCMVCRDFSAPDHHASLFPRYQVVSLQQLSQQLTSPFKNSATDQARVIFTWLHHNIRYDVDSFFANNVKASTPQSTLQSGLAVCEGYAALFTNIATYAGLESVVISGHGKGFGYTPLAPGSPIPPYNAGHAWNAVRIDGGEWKLIDACWGAGHVQGKGQPYVQEFHPEYFTMSNEEFGVKHFPGNKDMFFLPGDRRMSWEDYIQINPASWPLSVEPPTIFSSSSDYGIGKRTVMPRSRKVSPGQGGTVRFQFSLHCPHWTVEHTKKGPPPVFMVATHGADGRNKDFIPLEHVRGQTPGGGGDFWYCDIEARELGTPGQTVTLFAVSSFGDRQDARGLTVKEFRDGKGRVGMGFQGVAAWDLV